MLNSTYMQNFNIAVIQQGSTKVGAAQKSRVHSMADYNRVHCKGACCTANSIDVCDREFSTVRSTPHLSAVFWKYLSVESIP